MPPSPSSSPYMNSSSLSSSSSSPYVNFVHRPQHEQNANANVNAHPTPGRRQGTPQTPMYTPVSRAPLVLDPSSRQSLFASPQPPLSSKSASSLSLSMSQRRQQQQQQQRPSRLESTPVPQHHLLTEDGTAASFAKTAPKAGFLQKISSASNLLERRFFVLKPSTHLYYFTAPSDTEPRGCLDLEGSTVQVLQHMDNGRVRFQISWPQEYNQQSDRSSRTQRQQQSPIVLEARSADMAKEWMASLQQEQLSFVQHSLQQETQRTIGFGQRIADLETEVKNYRMMEEDRNGALEDAARWKQKYDTMNETIRILTMQLSRQQSQEESDENDNDNDNNEALETLAMKWNTEEHDDTYLGGLVNACQQLKQAVTLASQEASAAVDDLIEATATHEKLQTRMTKAEKHLCKLWEDNTALRQELKTIKQEKRVLVKEVKTLRGNAPITDGSASAVPVEEKTPEQQDNSSSGTSEGVRLIEELEQQVESTIRFHEAFLAKTRQSRTAVEPLLNTSIDYSTDGEDDDDDNGNNNSDSGDNHSGSTLKPKILSLLDDDSSSDEDNDEEDSEDDDQNESTTNISIISSVGADHGDGISVSESDAGSHPLAKLDETDEHHHEQTPTVSTSNVMQNGQATSRLECPLADVTGYGGNQATNEDGRVYHLTFYSRKIGLQFQKVPPAVFANGALTEAMTADLEQEGHDGNNTAAELRRRAMMTRRAMGLEGVDHENECAVASPLDAVLVCGFQGFDDAANHVRPKLGAHLVAFDGVSVELGRWTFESIRKSIQARGRPLTLSFRNDFLTTTQRAILTKAVSEVDAPRVAPKPKTLHRTTPQRHARSLPHSRTPSQDDSERSIILENLRWKDEEDNYSSASSNYIGGFSAGNSVGTNPADFRSFSEAGSSSVISGALGPLMGKLMNGLSKKDGDRPSYMSRDAESLESMPGHHDFRNSLL